MDTYKLKFTKLQNEIFRLLCIKAGSSLNQRGISRLLRVSPTAVSKSLPALEKEGLAKIERSKTMNLSSVGFNRDNPRAIALKRTENLRLVYESGLADFLEEKFPGCAVILFGSYSLGEDTEKSDIDIAVIGSKRKEVDLTEFEKLLERSINIQFYEDIDKINKNLKSNILNGITLSGAV
jgi:predicted nucleotidyltransferase